VAGGILAVDHLARDEWLDTHRMLLLGASLGSIFATIRGAIDDRVPQVVLVHGGASLSTTLDAGLRGVPARLRPALMRIARIPIDTFDPEHYVARIAPSCSAAKGASLDEHRSRRVRNRRVVNAVMTELLVARPQPLATLGIDYAFVAELVADAALAAGIRRRLSAAFRTTAASE
jgi:hypothetical protein